MIKRTLVLFLLVGASAACDNPLPDEAAVAPVRLPAQLCGQAADGIKTLTGSGGFTYAGAGEGTLDEEAWMKMDERQRDELLRLLAIDAACTSDQPSAETTARVRNEGGRVLSERVIETGPNLSSMNNE